MATDNQDWAQAVSGASSGINGSVTPLIGLGVLTRGATAVLVWVQATTGGGGLQAFGQMQGQTAGLGGPTGGQLPIFEWSLQGFTEHATSVDLGVYYVPCSGYDSVIFFASAGTVNFVANPVYAPWFYPAVGQQLGINSESVVIAADQILHWPMDDAGTNADDPITVAGVNVALGAGASSVIIPGVAGKHIRLLEANLYVVTAAVALVVLEDTSGFLMADIRTDAVMAQPRRLHGRVGGSGLGVQLRNTSGIASGTIAGELVAVQK